MRITRVFLDVHMGLAFQGLGAIAKDARTKLDAESVVVFLNRKTTAFKLMVGGQYLTYFKNDGKKIPLEALTMLPVHFGGNTLKYDKAVKAVLEKKGIGAQ